MTLTVNLSEAVTVAGGTPTLTLNDGGTATYTGGSGTNALTFSYTVAAGQNTADLAVTAVNLGTATVTDGAGNAANLSGAVTNPAGILQINTTTHITQVGNNYFLYNVNGTGPELKYGGAAVTVGEFGGWTPIGAVQVRAATMTWPGRTPAPVSTRCGAPTATATTCQAYGMVSGTSAALESLETTSARTSTATARSGVKKVVIHTNGSTALVEVANNFDHSNSSQDPQLKYGGSAVTVGRVWRLGADRRGPDVNRLRGCLDTRRIQYSVWTTDSNGNYVSGTTPFRVPVTRWNRWRQLSTRISTATGRSDLSRR